MCMPRVLRATSEVSWIRQSLLISHDSENQNAVDADVSRNKAMFMLGWIYADQLGSKKVQFEKDAGVSLFKLLH